MALLSDLIDRRTKEHLVLSSGQWYAKVTIPIPIEISDNLFVIIPEISLDIKWGPCRWNPRVLTLPVEGSEALVIFDNRQQPWVVAVWP